jgi:hypothetical protein
MKNANPYAVAIRIVLQRRVLLIQRLQQTKRIIWGILFKIPKCFVMWYGWTRFIELFSTPSQASRTRVIRNPPRSAHRGSIEPMESRQLFSLPKFPKCFLNFELFASIRLRTLGEFRMASELQLNPIFNFSFPRSAFNTSRNASLRSTRVSCLEAILSRVSRVRNVEAQCSLASTHLVAFYKRTSAYGSTESIRLR